jgi:basic membrane lipoprotein Med (substrate-binding protein (PBP1-ABC) superfamily)
VRIGVTGGRDYANPEKVRAALAIFDPWQRSPHTLVEGGARGADAHAHNFALDYGWDIQVFRADWDAYGKAAGPIRNQQMADSGLDVLIAFQGGTGTQDMVSRAKKAGVLVLRVDA